MRSSNLRLELSIQIDKDRVCPHIRQLHSFCKVILWDLPLHIGRNLTKFCTRLWIIIFVLIHDFFVAFAVIALLLLLLLLLPPTKFIFYFKKIGVFGKRFTGRTTPDYSPSFPLHEQSVCTFVCLFVWLVGFLTSSSTTRLYHGRGPRLTSDNFMCCHTRGRAGRPWLLSQPVTLYYTRTLLPRTRTIYLIYNWERCFVLTSRPL